MGTSRGAVCRERSIDMMTMSTLSWRKRTRLAAAASLSLGLVLGGLPAEAQTQPTQQKTPTQPQKAPAQQPKAPAQQQTQPKAPVLTPEQKAAQEKANKEAEQSAWVKLCEKAKVKKGDKIEELDICLTHHERIDGTSGQVIVSAALREVQGAEKKHLMIMVPLGVALPAGMQIKIDDDKEAMKLQYTICHPGGCTAEIEATPELVKKLKKGKQMIVAAMNITAKPFFLPVPLDGFERTITGAPVDPKLYAEARGNAMKEIMERQKALYEAAVKEAQARQEQQQKQTAAPADKAACEKAGKGWKWNDKGGKDGKGACVKA
ncbi:MAG: invasion protein [Hyphomicrobiaceae bacterium]|nr:MAG: invasion protein [Hyphomicrobiaceae bacterium]